MFSLMHCLDVNVLIFAQQTLVLVPVGRHWKYNASQETKQLQKGPLPKGMSIDHWTSK